jgi:hypothetical protein
MGSIPNWPMVHKSLGNIACEKHPIYAEDACLECEDLKELETAGVSPGTGRVIGKFVGTKSEFMKRLDAIRTFEGKAGVMEFLSR